MLWHGSGQEEEERGKDMHILEDQRVVIRAGVRGQCIRRKASLAGNGCRWIKLNLDKVREVGTGQRHAVGPLEVVVELEGDGQAVGADIAVLGRGNLGQFIGQELAIRSYHKGRTPEGITHFDAYHRRIEPGVSAVWELPVRHQKCTASMVWLGVGIARCATLRGSSRAGIVVGSPTGSHQERYHQEEG